MTIDEIVRVLGRAGVESVENSVSELLENIQPGVSRETAMAATSELLISMLAAVIITARDGAEERTEATVERLKDVVARASKLRSGGDTTD